MVAPDALLRTLAGTVEGLNPEPDDDATQGERLSDIAWALATVEQTRDSLRMALWAAEGILVRSNMFPANEAWRQLAANIVLYLLEDLGNLASQNGSHNVTPDSVWARLGPLSREAWLDSEAKWSSVEGADEQLPQVTNPALRKLVLPGYRVLADGRVVTLSAVIGREIRGDGNADSGREHL